MAHIDAAKPPQQSEYYFIPAFPINWVKCMKRCHHGLDGARARARHYYIPPLRQLAYRYGMDKQFPQHRINIIDTPGHVDFTIEVDVRCAC